MVIQKHKMLELISLINSADLFCSLNNEFFCNMWYNNISGEVYVVKADKNFPSTADYITIHWDLASGPMPILFNEPSEISTGLAESLDTIEEFQKAYYSRKYIEEIEMVTMEFKFALFKKYRFARPKPYHV